MVGSAGTPAMAKAEKTIVERVESVYRPDIVGFGVVSVQDEQTTGVAERVTG
jgi:hypothetical protein